MNGWTLWWHPAFAAQFIHLVEDVERLAEKESLDFVKHPKAKLLSRIEKLILEEIPAGPGSPEFAQGNTLGTDQRHWKRAKFLGRFRLFFQFNSQKNIIIYAWVNDESTLRKAGAATDPYTVFKKLLASGNPPADWDDLLATSARLSIPKQTR